MKEEQKRIEYVERIKLMTHEELLEETISQSDVSSYLHKRHQSCLAEIIEHEEVRDALELRTLKAESEVIKLKKEVAELNESNPKGWYNKTQIANYCGVSPRTVAEWVSLRRIKYSAPNGGKQLFQLKEADRMLEHLSVDDKY